MTSLRRRPAEIRYVEDELKMNELYDECQGALEELGAALAGFENNTENVRQYVQLVSDREDELFMKVAVDFAGQSVAAQDRELKKLKIEDVILAERQGELAHFREKLVSSETEVKIAERKHKMLVARITQQAHYLEFLAAYKQGRNVLNDTDLPDTRRR